MKKGCIHCGRPLDRNKTKYECWRCYQAIRDRIIKGMHYKKAVKDWETKLGLNYD